MKLSIGDKVTHSMHPTWGVGTVLEEFKCPSGDSYHLVDWPTYDGGVFGYICEPKQQRRWCVSLFLDPAPDPKWII